MESLKILGLCIGAAIAYGIAHDLVTANLSVEYFSIAHPPLFGAHTPVQYAIAWGVAATWWVGLMLGVPATAVSRWGRRPKLSSRDLTIPVAILLGVMACLAGLAGLYAYIQFGAGRIEIPAAYAGQIPEEHHRGFAVAMWMHLTSYIAGFLGGLVVIVGLLLTRVRRARAQEA